MRKLSAMVCFVVFIGIGFGCEASQEDLSKGEYVSYMFDPASKTCAVVIEPGAQRSVAWQVPCTPAVVKKLSPSVREEAEAAFNASNGLPSECPR